MRDLHVFQEEVGEWKIRNFPEVNVELSALLLAEEVGEVCRAILKREQDYRGTAEEWAKELRSEIGDVLIAVVGLAFTEGLDICHLLEDRWNFVRERGRRTE